MNCSVAWNLQKLPISDKKSTIGTEKDWNLIIRQNAKLKNDKAILSTSTQMESLAILPDTTALPLILKACSRLNAVEKGKIIHETFKGTQLLEDVRVGTALVDFYCKCGLVGDARQVFDEMPEKDLVSWNAMISGYAGNGVYVEPVLLFREMQKDGLRPNSRTVVALLSVFKMVLDVRLGQQLHCFCLRNWLLDWDPHVGTALIGFYLRYDVRAARLVFNSMAYTNIVTWNAMITTYFETGNYSDALALFVLMLQNDIKIDSVTMLVVIQACAGYECKKMCMQIHQVTIKLSYIDDLFIVNALINMYSDHRCLKLARNLFKSIVLSDQALWNSIISAHIEHGVYAEAITLFVEMQTSSVGENERTMVIMLSLCEDMVDGLKLGRSLHAHGSKKGMKTDHSFGTALLSMYAELDCTESARNIFETIHDVDVISCNALMSALVRNGFRIEAFELFRTMQESESNKPNAYTVVSLLPFCKDETYSDIGRSIHGFAVKQGFDVKPTVNTALTDMYMNCGDEYTATYLFECCSNRDLVSWNSLIASYVKHNEPIKALRLFNRMILVTEPNSVTLLNIISACTDLSHMLCLHAYTLRRDISFHSNSSLANAFITAYAKYGSISKAENTFRLLLKRNIVSWNAIITGYAVHGRGEDAVSAFLRMQKDGFKPNGVTLLSVLSACGHSGLINKGLSIFNSMVDDYKIIPEMAHYGCVVDLLGRAGQLEEALELIKSMPFEADASVWRTLLSACRDYCDTKQATAVFKKLIELEPMNAGNFVLLSNIYAEAGRWEDVRELRRLVKDKGLRKPPGESWIVIRGALHSFTVADTSHHLSNEIYKALSSLMSSIRETEYDPLHNNA